jgi:hypothetical protein
LWTYEHSVETDAAPDAIYRVWADVEHWGTWNADIESIETSGPFEAGCAIVMTPAGQDPVHLRVTEAVAGERFVDEARFDGLVLRTTHRIEPGRAQRSRVTYRMEITGEGCDEAGPQIGPAITADWPETMAGLVKVAAG